MDNQKIIDALEIANEANIAEAQGDKKLSKAYYDKAITSLEKILQEETNPNINDIFQAFLKDWKSKSKQLGDLKI